MKEKEREYFSRLADELASLRECEPGEKSFLEKHYKKIERLLELSYFETYSGYKHYYKNTYKRFKRKYLRFWYKRLRPYRLGECAQRTLEELRVGKEYLTEFLEVLNRIPSLRKALGTNQMAFLRSNHYALQALVLMKENGDVEQILRNWHKAGEVCKPRERKLRMPEDFDLLAQGENCFAQKYKLQAFYCARKEPTDFNEVISNMEESKKHAERALSRYGQAGNSRLQANASKHIAYISYWTSVFVSRQSLLDLDFEKSKSAIKEAIDHAKLVDPAAERIFPNRFRDFQDLENEDYFIQACEALVRADLDLCKKSIESWLAQSNAIRGTRRYLNIDLRKEAVECLIHRYISKDSDAYSRTMDRLRDRLHSGPQVGHNTRSMINIVKRGFRMKEAACWELYSVFPLDTAPAYEYQDKIFEAPKEEKLRQLPPFYRDWLNISGLHSAEAFLRIDYILFSYIRSVAEHCYHYFELMTRCGKISQTLPEDSPVDFSKIGWNGVGKAIEPLCGVLQNTKKGDSLRKLLESIASYEDSVASIRSELFRGSNIDSRLDVHFVTKLAERVLEILGETGWYLFPHPVKVKDIAERIEHGQVAYTLERIWGRDLKETRVSLSTSQPRLEKNRFYFLGHKWKSQNHDYLDYIPTPGEEFFILRSISFGVPRKDCVLLFEGDAEGAALPILLDRLCPHWKILDIHLIKGVGDTTVPTYRALRRANKDVVTIADRDVLDKARWRSVTKDEKNTFVLVPDFEGMNLECLRRAINSIYPELEIDIADLKDIIENRVKDHKWTGWGGTLDGAFKQYLSTCVPECERPRYIVEKTELAILLAKEMVQRGIPEQIERALNRLLDLAEGREEYE